MTDVPNEPDEPDAAEPASDDEYEDHPGADTLSVPSWDDAGYLRWGHLDHDEAPLVGRK